ncbi:hypothetical protein, partial [Roseibium hamelinense]|uniref:hypothetical protein n=1 Tax=Roseibium hamelinense TaxID=150831 RepID=UPI001AD8D2C6
PPAFVLSQDQTLRFNLKVQSQAALINRYKALKQSHLCDRELTRAQLTQGPKTPSQSASLFERSAYLRNS